MASVVGSGDYTYELVPSWPNMPKHWTFGSASDAAVNSDDEVHVFSRGKHPITIWDKGGGSFRRGAKGRSPRTVRTVSSLHRITTSG